MTPAADSASTSTRNGVDPWRPFGSGSSKDAFEGDQAIPWKIVRSTADAEWHGLGLERPAVTALNGFACLSTLGFRRASLLSRPSSKLL